MNSWMNEKRVNYSILHLIQTRCEGKREKLDRDFKNNVPKIRPFERSGFSARLRDSLLFLSIHFRNPKITQRNRHLYLK